MPVERDAGQLPGWAADPRVGDFADPPTLAWERAQDQLGPGGVSYTAVSRAHDRLVYALDLAYGKNLIPRALIKPPRTGGDDRLPVSAPPGELRAAVLAWQSEEDARHRAQIRRNSPHDFEGMLARCHVPPALLPGPDG